MPKIDISEKAGMAYSLFENCNSLKSLDLSSLAIKSTRNIEKMFKNCYSLTSIDISRFNTSNIYYMASMFESCSKLSSLDLKHFNTNQANDMSFMFNNCTNLEFLNVKFNTEKVQRMDYMFGSCTKLNSLDITTFNTEICKNFTNMFLNDENLNLYINNDTCSSLVDKIPPYVNIHNNSDIS